MASPSKVSTQLEPWCDLEDKVVLITGASSGLGWDFCITLAKAGCKVIAAARRADRLKSLCDQINQSSTTPRAVALALDVTADAPAIEAAVEQAWASFGHIDCLINNSGIRGEKGRRIRELTSVVQKRFKFPENSVELYAEKVTNSGLCVIAQAESLRYKFLGGLAVRSSRIVRKKEKPWRLKIDGKFP